MKLSGDIELNSGPSESPNRSNIHENSFMSTVEKIQAQASIFHLNCCSLVSIIDELRAMFSSLKPLLITTSETWLNCSISDTEVNIDEYKIERYDRDRLGRGGGVAIYVRNAIKYTR